MVSLSFLHKVFCIYSQCPQETKKSLLFLTGEFPLLHYRYVGEPFTISSINLLFWIEVRVQGFSAASFCKRKISVLNEFTCKLGQTSRMLLCTRSEIKIFETTTRHIHIYSAIFTCFKGSTKHQWASPDYLNHIQANTLCMIFHLMIKSYSLIDSYYLQCLQRARK